ncbi:MAG: Hpt domain-containing protein, partial [Gammaproteobacteria bacterium]|nr:Hpt domain-containing protein [Gammaproteobacteria bacterium]
AGLDSSMVETENIIIETVAGVEGTITQENAKLDPATVADERSFAAPAEVSGIQTSGPTPVRAAPPPAAPAKSLAPSSAGPAVVPAAEVDPEIVEIFLEEAQEEINSLRENFPRWRSNPADSEALTTVRRSLHTLKGSGRMVGARLIGEFAWSFENMLNRVIDQTVQPSDGMFALLEQGIAALPELVEQLEVGTAPQADVQPIMDAASAFSRGEQPRVPKSATSTPRRAATAHTETQFAAPAAAVSRATGTSWQAQTMGLDPQLYEIFSRETEGHLGVLAKFLAQAQTHPQQRLPSEELVRAMHTLHGSASMAGATGLAALIEPAGRYLSDLAAHDSPVAAEHLTLLDEILNAARVQVSELGTAGAMPVADAALLARARELKLSGAPGEAATAAAEPAAMMASRHTAARPAQAQERLRYVQLSDLKDFDPELAGIFFEEATELLDSTDNTLHQWSQKRNDSTLVAQLQRNLHTLKGGARMAGITPMGDLSHELETVLTDVVDGRIAISTELFALLNRSVDRLHRMLEQGYSSRPIVDAGDLVTDLKRIHGHTVDEELAPEKPEDKYETVRATPPPPVMELKEIRTPPDLAGEIREAEEEPGPEAALGGASDRRGTSRIQYELVRVRADLLESALNFAGEVGIYRSRLEQQVHSINFNLTELEQTVVRLRDQLRKLEIETEAQILYQFQQEGGEKEHPEFDPLELDRYSLLQQLSRALAESVGDLVSLQALLLNQAREAETLLLQQSRVTTELQDGLMRTRMVPFSRHAQRLRRVVRQTADESGKHVDLKLIGAEGEMDRQVLERVLAPLEHMLRNSVVHGIEKPEARRRSKKPAMGIITITMSREGSEVVMEVTDDGAGLNLQAIRRKAEDLGLTRADVKLSDRDIMAFILEPGFSTAEQVTQTAGRGVGMDVVASEIKQLGGSLRIDSSSGKGARFIIRLPFTLAITQALLVNMADQVYAIPLPSIEGIARIPRNELERLMIGENPSYTYGNRPYQLQHLSVLLGVGAPQFPQELTTVPLLLVRSGDINFALITEGMQGSREVVVKSVGPQVSNIRGISGATILGDGSILLILDVTALTRGLVHVEEVSAEVVDREVPQEDTRIFAMVVDDSITVRRVTQRLLERYDMRVLTAKDGVDALALLQENKPDVMLLDIEMPRMDGYELAQHMRNDERFKGIPIIMITSRTGEKHRNRAMQIGVNKYLGKPYQEAELLEDIQELVGKFHPQHTRWE